MLGRLAANRLAGIRQSFRQVFFRFILYSLFHSSIAFSNLCLCLLQTSRCFSTALNYVSSRLFFLLIFYFNLLCCVNLMKCPIFVGLTSGNLMCCSILIPRITILICHGNSPSPTKKRLVLRMLSEFWNFWRFSSEMGVSF